MSLTISIPPVFTPAFNPIVVNVTRNDGSFLTVTDNGGGTIKVNVAGLHELVNRDKIYIYGSVYSGEYEVSSSTTAYIIINTAYISTDSGYIIADAAKPNWYANIVIEYTANGTTWVELTEVRVRSGLAGLGTFRLDGFLRTLFTKANISAYNTANIIDSYMDIGYRFKYIEVWDDSDEYSPTPSYSAYTSEEHSLCAALELQDSMFLVDSSINPLKYCLLTDAGSPIYPLVPFYTEFEEMRFFPGYPFDISVPILDEGMVLFDAKLKEKIYTVNNLKTGEADYLLSLANPKDFWLNRLTISESYASTISYIEATLYLIAKGISPFTAEEYAQTETKKIRIDRECTYSDPIFLAWINKYGAWDYWLFGARREDSLSILKHERGEQVLSNYRIAQTLNETLKKDSQKVQMLTAVNIRAAEVEGIKGLLRSPFVQMLTNDGTFMSGQYGSPAVAPAWMTVIIKENTFNFGKHDQSNFVVQFELEFPVHQSQMF